MKDFIPYEEALELKQLRFDEPCFATYIGETFDSSVQFQSDDYFTAAPLFQQAFRFFREKYNLVHEICEHPKEMIDYVVSKGERCLPTYSYGYSSNGRYHPISNTYIYEEGEIGCLKKFIEIVKQKQ